MIADESTGPARSGKWVKMYIRRWLGSPVQTKDGGLIQKQEKGTPQGGVISPLLANLYQRAEIVEKREDYRCSSARNYVGLEGLI